jgi:homoserine O-acetyltransferase
MYGPGQPLDLTRYFVIASDTIGAGKSSKPSDGLRMQLPMYRHDDVVKAQYTLLTEGLGVRRLHAVIGISFGGRQAWQWSVQYPEFMRGVVPLISSPFANAGRRGMQDFLGIEPILSSTLSIYAA